MDARFVVPGPLDIAGTLSRYRLWGEDPVNRLSDGVFRRAIKWEGRWRGYELRWSDDAHAPRLTVSVPGARRAALVDAAVAEAGSASCAPACPTSPTSRRSAPSCW